MARRHNLIFFIIFAVFFGFLLVTGEPISVGDTFQYENQMVMREPIYALLIQALRFVSPKAHYWLIIILQNILAIAANTVFIAWIRKRFGLNVWVSLLFTAILLVPHIMTPIFASTHLVLTNALMTEGILFSLYPLAMMCLMNMLWSGKAVGRESLTTIGLFLLLSLIRGQMMVLFVVWFLVAFVLAVKNAVKDRKNTFDLAENIAKRGFLAAVAVFIIAFAARSVLIRVYNYCEQGLFVETASGKAMSFANILYVADRSDGDAIAEDALRQLFYEMYDAADADKMNYTDRYQELMIAVDGVAVQLSSALMPQVLGRYIQNYITVITLGFIRTVAYEHPLLAWYALLIYIVAVVLTIVLWKKDHESMAAAFMAVMLVTIVGNVCATALMIQCISRYMIYNLPLFYMAGFLELLELFGVKSRKAS